MIAFLLWRRVKSWAENCNSRELLEVAAEDVCASSFVDPLEARENERRIRRNLRAAALARACLSGNWLAFGKFLLKDLSVGVKEPATIPDERVLSRLVAAAKTC